MSSSPSTSFNVTNTITYADQGRGNRYEANHNFMAEKISFGNLSLEDHLLSGGKLLITYLRSLDKSFLQISHDFPMTCCGSFLAI